MKKESTRLPLLAASKRIEKKKHNVVIPLAVINKPVITRVSLPVTNKV